MTNQNDFDELKKASLNDLKRLKIIKSISVCKMEFGRYKAILEDYNSNSIEILIGLKSSEYINHEIEITQSFLDSAYIVLINENEKILRLTTSEYSSNGQLREVFGTSISPEENKEMMDIKDILIEKGLKI